MDTDPQVPLILITGGGRGVGAARTQEETPVFRARLRAAARWRSVACTSPS
jgi:hypothetical protein